MILSVLLGASIAEAQTAPNLPAPTYAVAFAGTEFKKGQKIGSKKAGLLCLPNGPVRWGREDFHLDGHELLEAVRSSLAARGVAAPSSRATAFLGNAGEEATHLIGVTVTGGRFDLCVPRWGLGDRRGVRGGATLEAKWELFSKVEQKVVASAVTRRAFSGQAPDFAALVGNLIDGSVDQFLHDAKVVLPTRRSISRPKPD